MSLTFRGTWLHKVDTKGRVSIPAPYRRVLEAGDPDWEPGKAPRVAIAHGDPSNKRFECFPIVEIERLARVIKRMPQGDHREALQELYSSQVTDTTLDDNGRVVLSQAHRDKFGIKGEARFVSAIDKFEIWSPDRYADKADRLQKLFEELGDRDPLSLLDAFDDEVDTSAGR